MAGVLFWFVAFDGLQAGAASRRAAQGSMPTVA
jgi:hypothetical protein